MPGGELNNRPVGINKAILIATNNNITSLNS
jgi:hypothetical protein